MPARQIEVWRSAEFLKVFARHLKYNPTDNHVYANGLTIAAMSENIIWFFSDQFLSGKIPRDYITYFYKLFAGPAVFLHDYLRPEVKQLFFDSLTKHSLEYKFFWESEYVMGRPGSGAINMDDIGNMSGIQLAFALKQTTPNKQLQWMKGFRRYYERFMSYTPGTADGIKSDGSSFHHFTALNNYTYNFNTPMFVLSVLDQTSFQVSAESYLIFRKAVYTQLFLANDNMEALSMSGRNVQARGVTIHQTYFRNLAGVGGRILGLSGPDPVVANAYVRQWGPHVDLPQAQAETRAGFKPLNYHGAGVYWKNNWMAVSRGQSNWSFGSEMIGTKQHYGRYQSYGALEIIYPGGELVGNGFAKDGWNWNFHPGTTSIVLPWNLLRVENEHQKEYQKKGFVGALYNQHKTHGVYTQSFGVTGIFAMDFAESDENHGSKPIGPNTHNPSFTFKKSVFYFKNFMVALGSDINNDDSSHPTVTTLFQRLSSDQAEMTINGTTHTAFATQTLTGANWLIDNFQTGFYVVAENGNQLITQRKLQRIPYYQDFDYTLADPRSPVDYSMAYIDHGNAPAQAGYEYVVMPATTKPQMSDFATTMANAALKPYQVLRKNQSAHIVKDTVHGTVGYALFSVQTHLPTELLIQSNSVPCLIMYTEGDEDDLSLSVVNPNLEFTIQGFELSQIIPIDLVLDGLWAMPHASSDAEVLNQDLNAQTSTIRFYTYDGKVIESQLVKSDRIHINFQPAPAPSVVAYEIDSGEAFGDRGNGFTYGWSAANHSTRDRNDPSTSDQKKDTLIHFSKNTPSPGVSNCQTEATTCILSVATPAIRTKRII